MNRYVLAALCALSLSSAAIADGPPAAQPATNGTAVYPGTQSFSLPHHSARASGQPNDVTLNFPNADVHEVAKAILGDILGLNYAVDPSASGSVTVQTAEPVAKVDVLPILEELLTAAKLGLIKKGTVYTIIPIDKAKRQPQLLNATEAGYGSESITLHYVNAVELKKLLDPLVPESSISQADPGRNIMLITGTADQRNALRDLIRQFDVNWLHGMSFALLVPERTDAHMLQPELDAIVNTPNSPTQGLVKLVVIDRLNGILAISPQPQYLKDLKKWMQVLDRAGGDNDRKLFVYHVQNGRAADVATVLINAFGGGTGGSTTPAHPTGPNLQATGQPSQIGGATSGLGGTQSGGGLGGTGVGKFLGCWLACGLTLLVFYVFFGTLAAVRERELHLLQLVQAGFLHWVMLGVLIAMCLLGSIVFAAPSSNGTICFVVTVGILFLGRHLNKLAMGLSEPASSFVYGIYFAIPHLEIFDVRDLVIHEAALVPWGAVFFAGVYAAVYVSLLLVSTWVLFRRKALN